MTFPNPTRLSAMTEPELQREIEFRMNGMWEHPENRIRIDDCYKELNRREARAHPIRHGARQTTNQSTQLGTGHSAITEAGSTRS